MKIYTASKIIHAQMWRDLRREFPSIFFTAHWPDLIALNLESDKSPLVFRDAWEQNIADVLEADVLILFHLQGERHEGSFIEVGAALAAGKRVHIISDAIDELGKWKWHPSISIWKLSLRDLLRQLLKGEQS